MSGMRRLPHTCRAKPDYYRGSSERMEAEPMWAPILMVGRESGQKPQPPAIWSKTIWLALDSWPVGKGQRSLQRRVGGALLPFALAFHNLDVTIDWQIVKPLNRVAGLRPLHLQPIDLCSFPNTEHQAWIV